jgi:uncharacterized protein YndB with AHSA1/START domain
MAHSLTVSRDIPLQPADVYEAFTSRRFENWFAAPGTLQMRAEVSAPFFFERHYQGERHSHYGRFLRLERDRLIEMTWATAAGTRGVETVVTVRLQPIGLGTRVTLTHAGFPDGESTQRHADAWPRVLEELEQLAGHAPTP